MLISSFFGVCFARSASLFRDVVRSRCFFSRCYFRIRLRMLRFRIKCFWNNFFPLSLFLLLCVVCSVWKLLEPNSCFSFFLFHLLFVCVCFFFVDEMETKWKIDRQSKLEANIVLYEYFIFLVSLLRSCALLFYVIFLDVVCALRVVVAGRSLLSLSL